MSGHKAWGARGRIETLAEAVRCHPPDGLEKGILEPGKLHCTQMRR